MSYYLCGFRKGFNTQHSLLDLLKPKTKLHAYGLDKNELRMINSYLSDRWQRIKINTAWSQLLLCVPQRYVLDQKINSPFFIISFFYFSYQ